MLEKLRWRWRRRSGGIAYWKDRARLYGKRAVFNLGHDAGETRAVTEKQVSVLLPLLRAQLRGDERLSLDFGCGTGRFTPLLAEATAGRSIGVDPVDEFLAAAPAHPSIEYKVIDSPSLPFDDHTFDLVWICLVLGTIVDDAGLAATAAEIERVLKPGGLLFVAENTAERKSLSHFRFRSVAAYRAMFRSTPLEVAGHYDDLDERISVLAGRKTAE